jgi:prepilin-type N-terminal cleavage/methylation domain-containing protein
VQTKTERKKFQTIERRIRKVNFLDLRRLRKRLPKNNQNGFTLIELLVVISILGILAAVVTMSLVGITKVAQQRAFETEKQTVQVAMDTMLADQGVDVNDACTGAPTAANPSNNMTAFPTSNAWTANNGGGTSHATVSLYPHYLREPATHGTYYCSGLGEIVPVAFTP